MTESRIRGELERKDPAGSGLVSEQALGKVLGKLGADLTGADLGRLMHRFDVHEVREKNRSRWHVNTYSCLHNGVPCAFLCYRLAALRERWTDGYGSHVMRPLSGEYQSGAVATTWGLRRRGCVFCGRRVNSVCVVWGQYVLRRTGGYRRHQYFSERESLPPRPEVSSPRAFRTCVMIRDAFRR